MISSALPSARKTATPAGIHWRYGVQPHTHTHAHRLAPPCRNLRCAHLFLAFNSYSWNALQCDFFQRSIAASQAVFFSSFRALWPSFLTATQTSGLFQCPADFKSNKLQRNCFKNRPDASVWMLHSKLDSVCLNDRV